MIWTERGKPLSAADKAVIRKVSEEHPVAARIFVTGEVHESYIGKDPSLVLCAVNDVLGPPLFTMTKSATVRMLRFKPMDVWSAIHPDAFKTLLETEVNRLGLLEPEEFLLNHEDFYYSYIESLKDKQGFSLPLLSAEGYSEVEGFYHSLYLGALLLYGKPGYMAVPITEHFSLPACEKFLWGAKFLPLSIEEKDELTHMQREYGKLDGITNAELEFLMKLYDARR